MWRLDLRLKTQQTLLATKHQLRAGPGNIQEWTNHLGYFKNLHARVGSQIPQQHANRKRQENKSMRFTLFTEREKVWEK